MAFSDHVGVAGLILGQSATGVASYNSASQPTLEAQSHFSSPWRKTS